VNMKERILMSGMEYSVLKEEMKEDRCGWSNRFCGAGSRARIRTRPACKAIYN
jgi:hypothetical protein